MTKVEAGAIREESDGSARKTCTGCTVPPLERGLPKVVGSLCPECGLRIDAQLHDVGGRVMMTKTCPEHGTFEDVYWGDTQLYLKAEEYHYGDGVGLENPQSDGDGEECPSACGLCGGHASHAALANIDLTNRCNLKCPICFANSDAQGFVYEPTYEQVLTMLRVFRETRPVAGRVIQFSGGEPTLSPHFLEAIRYSKEIGYFAVQCASNGVRFAQEPGFAKAAAEAGLRLV